MSEPIAVQAYDRVVAVGAVHIVSGLQPTGKLGEFTFVFELPVPHPNTEGLPARVAVRATIPEQFPFSAVRFIPVDPCISGFPHQDAQTRALCLEPQSSYPHTPTDRLLAYILSVSNWFEAAATGRLLKPGDTWELPDFRTDTPVAFPELFFLESTTSFREWEPHIGEQGEVQLVEHICGRGIVPVRFTRNEGAPILPAISADFRNDHRSLLGIWVLLPSLVVFRHRAAQTFRELGDYCTEKGINFWRCLGRAKKQKPYRGHHVVLIGAPIPRKVDEEPSEIHWQLVAIPSRNHANRTSRASGSTRLRGELAEVAIPWVSSRNVTDQRVEARGVLSAEARRARVCLVGCGALGSLFAEFLCRGGVRELSLFDKDVLELENLSRHTLGTTDVGLGKADRLRKRLAGAHPSLTIRSFPFCLPLRSILTKTEMPAWKAINDADVLIDCTADSTAFRWASAFGRDKGKLVLHAFINAHARMLTVCSSGKHARCAAVVDKLYTDIRDGKAGILWEEYDPREVELVQGAGCWHPTFPARGSDIAALAASVVPLLERLIEDGLRSSTGAAFVLRRREIPATITEFSAPIVEIAWHARYR